MLKPRKNMHRKPQKGVSIGVTPSNSLNCRGQHVNALVCLTATPNLVLCGTIVHTKTRHPMQWHGHPTNRCCLLAVTADSNALRVDQPGKVML
jgi:hypothetical protein